MHFFGWNLFQKPSEAGDDMEKDESKLARTEPMQTANNQRAPEDDSKECGGFRWLMVVFDFCLRNIGIISQQCAWLSGSYNIPLVQVGSDSRGNLLVI